MAKIQDWFDKILLTEALWKVARHKPLLGQSNEQFDPCMEAKIFEELNGRCFGD